MPDVDPWPAQPLPDLQPHHPAGDRSSAAARPLPRRAPLALPAGTRLHEYRIERVLGQGGFGITYLATDVHLDAAVAIKEYLPEEIAFRAADRTVSPNATRHRERYREGLDSFLTEARTLAALRHPAIVRVARFFEAHGTAYMVLEYERGQPLKLWWPQQLQAAERRGVEGLRRLERELAERLLPLLDGLAAVHTTGFLHRDIKPDNIQVRAEDGSFVLLDFGSAGQAAAVAPQGAVVLTPGYAPIEQYGLGEQGPWTDVYALGATLYWCLTGHKPPDAEQRSIDPASFRPAAEVAAGRFGAPLLRAIDAALAMDAAQRPRDVPALRRALLAGHAGSLGLADALALGEAASEADDSELEGDAGRAGRSRAGDGSGMAALPLAARARQLPGRLQRGWRQAARRIAPADWPLALKLALLVLASALLPLAVSGGINWRGSYDALAAAQLRNAELLAASTAGRIGQRLADTRALARALATDVELAAWLAAPDPAAAAALTERLRRLAQANPDIQLLMLMDAAGTARLSNDAEVAGRNFAFRQYFQEAIAGRPFTSGVVVGAVAGQAGVFFAEPLRAGGAATDAAPVLGALVLRLHASAFGQLLDAVRHEADLQPFLIDGDGVLLHHRREDLVFRSLMPLSAAQQQAIAADQRFRREQVEAIGQGELARAMIGAAEPGHVSYRNVLSDEAEIAGFAPVPGHDWVVGVSESQALFEQPLVALRDRQLWVMGAAGVLAVVLALWLAGRIVRPITALTGAADRLKAGDFDGAELRVTTRDEIGQLGRTFNVMIDVLRQRERERRR